ncbi:MAG: dihydrofolate reductase family protein [Pseudomonadota bacterium]
MRRITGAFFQSLDGVVQAPGGPTEDPTGGFAHGGWLAGLFDQQAGDAIDRLFTPPYDLLLGRRTYEIFAAYWPYAEGENAAMGKAFDAAGKYVLTRGDPPLPWANSHRLAGVEDVAKVKAGDGPDLIIQGSSTIYPALLTAGLIDRLIVLTFPVMLGSGKRVFGADTPPKTLKMTEQTVSPGGTIVATYEPGGAVETGSFGTVDSERERERQRRMEDGSW